MNKEQAESLLNMYRLGMLGSSFNTSEEDKMAIETARRILAESTEVSSQSLAEIAKLNPDNFTE